MKLRSQHSVLLGLLRSRRALLALAFAFAMAYPAYRLARRHFRHHTYQENLERSIFTKEYPEEERYREELRQLFSNGQLSEQNGTLIRQTVADVSRQLHMPSAILWCLLFQESRLDNLIGLHGERTAHGLGQFSHFSFFEVNHHLTQFDESNLDAMLSTLGKDVRPISANRTTPYAVSSYYSIPTAIVSSASFLNNRYHHLQQILERADFEYDPEVLWLWATVGYNKGTRSVLNIWNTVRKKNGNEGLELITTKLDPMLDTLANRKFVTRALQRVWTAEEAEHYAKELVIHVSNISECSLSTRSSLVRKVPE